MAYWIDTIGGRRVATVGSAEDVPAAMKHDGVRVLRTDSIEPAMFDQVRHAVLVGYEVTISPTPLAPPPGTVVWS